MSNRNPVYNSVWLTQWIRKTMRKNRNLISLFVGDSGSSESLAYIRLEEVIDPGL